MNAQGGAGMDPMNVIYAVGCVLRPLILPSNSAWVDPVGWVEIRAQPSYPVVGRINDALQDRSIVRAGQWPPTLRDLRFGFGLH